MVTPPVEAPNQPGQRASFDAKYEADNVHGPGTLSMNGTHKSRDVKWMKTRLFERWKKNEA